MSNRVQARAVIGANFGDEGKGLMTDYLVSKHKSDLVVRFNGGAQAGHTVVTRDNRERHVFGHVGSGAFAGASTLLSRFFIVNPMVFRRELDKLSTLTIPRTGRRIMVDRRAPVTTPFEMYLNQLVEEKRGAGRHGSCGLGIGETIERETAGLTIKVEELFNLGRLKDHLHWLRSVWVPQRKLSLGLDAEAGNEIIMSDGLVDNYLEDVKHFLKKVHVVEDTDVIGDASDVVFEGAQGLLLDQQHYFFPHVTRSNTGIKNPLVLCNEIGIRELEVVYVTRTYLTRHGAGPLPGELEGVVPFSRVSDDTNVENQFQGKLRYAPINVELLKKTIIADLLTNQTNVKVKPRLAVTCVDQTDDYTGDNDTGDKFARELGYFGDHFKSYGPTRHDVKDVMAEADFLIENDRSNIS